MSSKKDGLTLAQVLEVMKKAFEKRFDCSIDLYKGPDIIAIIHFNYHDRHEVSIQLTANAEHIVSQAPIGYHTDIHPLAHALKNASALLRLLEQTYKS